MRRLWHPWFHGQPIRVNTYPRSVGCYRKKPVVIEALRYTGKNHEEVGEFAGFSAALTANGELVIKTLEDGELNHAVHVASPGDWIIKGVKGEFYPCKPDIFEQTYEPVAEGQA